MKSGKCGSVVCRSWSGEGALHTVELKAEPVAGDGVADGLMGIESDADALDVVGGYALGLDGLSVGVVDGVGHIASSGSVYALGLVVEVRGESVSEASEVSELYGVSAQELFDDHLLEGVEDGLDVGRGEGTLADDAFDDVGDTDDGEGSQSGIPLIHFGVARQVALFLHEFETHNPKLCFLLMVCVVILRLVAYS